MTTITSSPSCASLVSAQDINRQGMAVWMREPRVTVHDHATLDIWDNSTYRCLLMGGYVLLGLILMVVGAGALLGGWGLWLPVGVLVTLASYVMAEAHCTRWLNMAAERTLLARNTSTLWRAFSDRRHGQEGSRLPYSGCFVASAQDSSGRVLIALITLLPFDERHRELRGHVNQLRTLPVGATIEQISEAMGEFAAEAEVREQAARDAWLLTQGECRLQTDEHLRTAADLRLAQQAILR